MMLQRLTFLGATFVVFVGCGLPSYVSSGQVSAGNIWISNSAPRVVPKDELSASPRVVNKGLGTLASHAVLDSSQIDPAFAEAILGERVYDDSTEEPTPHLTVPNEPEVNRFVRIYNGKRRSCVMTAYHRRKQFAPIVEKTFREYGLPQELIHVAMVESNYRPTARSKMGAVGLWQFIASTARQYGLRVGKTIDERKDVQKATVAAAQLLSSLHSQYNDWNLALAAYNAGEGTVNRAIARGGTRDFFALARKGYFRRETFDYVAQIMAITLIHREINAYAFETDEPVRYARAGL